MKRNNMTKTLLLLVIALGMNVSALVAQNVGVNVDDPQATLEVRGINPNNDVVEGLLIPRVSKNKAYLMSTNDSLKESTMVYVNTLDDYSTEPAAAAVADITKNGFYFWNGEQWVLNAGKDGAIWKYANDKIFLDREIVTDNVSYLKNGGFRQFPRIMRPVTGLNTAGQLVDTTLNLEASIYNWRLSFSDLITGESLSNAYPYKSLTRNTLFIDEKETSNIRNYHAEINSLRTTHRTTNDFTSLFASISEVVHAGGGDVTRIVGNYSNVYSINKDSKIIAMHGAIHQATAGTASGKVTRIEGARNVASLRGQDSISFVVGTNSHVDIHESAIHPVRNVYVNLNEFHSVSGGTAEIDNLYGLKSRFVPGTSTIKKMYGFYISGVGYGTEANYGIYLENIRNATTSTNNYAIYTNAGRISLGDVLQLRATRTPSSSTDVLSTDKEGDVIRDANYIYILTDVNGTLAWKRTALEGSW